MHVTLVTALFYFLKMSMAFGVIILSVLSVDITTRVVLCPGYISWICVTIDCIEIKLDIIITRTSDGEVTAFCFYLHIFFYFYEVEQLLPAMIQRCFDLT